MPQFTIPLATIEEATRMQLYNELATKEGWDEVSSSVVGNNLFVNAGRVDYNYAELTVDFGTTARYTNEFIGVVSQFSHRREDYSEIRPHLHWMQTSDNNPNILIAYRTCNNGDVFTGWTLKALTAANNVFPFLANAQQITEFDLPSSVGEALGISATFECKIYRDSTNASGLFAGADSYSGNWSVKYYDIHFKVDQDRGSNEEFKKIV